MFILREKNIFYSFIAFFIDLFFIVSSVFLDHNFMLCFDILLLCVLNSFVDVYTGSACVTSIKFCYCSFCILPISCILLADELRSLIEDSHFPGWNKQLQRSVWARRGSAGRRDRCEWYQLRLRGAEAVPEGAKGTYLLRPVLWPVHGAFT